MALSVDLPVEFLLCPVGGGGISSPRARGFTGAPFIHSPQRLEIETPLREG